MKNTTVQPSLPTSFQAGEILNTTDDVVIIADADCNIVKWNRAAERLLLGRCELLPGASLRAVLEYLFGDISSICKRFNRVLGSSVPEEHFQVVGLGGRLLSLSCYLQKLSQDSGVVNIAVIIREPEGHSLPPDNRPQRYSIGLDKEIFHSYLEHGDASAWIADEAGRVIFANKQARKKWHFPNDYEGMHTRQLFPAAEAERLIELDSEVSGTGEPATKLIPCRRLDGSAGFYILHKYKIVAPDEKTLVAGQAFEINADADRLAETADANERFSYAAKAVSDCIWDWDLKKGPVWRSDSLLSLTGYSETDIRNTHEWWMSRIHQEDRDRTDKAFLQAIEKGEVYCEASYRFKCANHRYKYFVDKGYILYESRKAVRIIGAVHDVTEKKRYQAKLQKERIRKQKEISKAIIAAQDHLSNEVAKELHDNVNQILVAASIMLRLAGEKAAGKSHEFIEKGHTYLQEAMKEIRKISRSLNTSVIRDIGFITPVETIAEHLRLAAGIKVLFECDASIESKLPDDQKLMLYRIVQEQTNNIMKHAGATEVTIRVTESNDSIRLTVADNGKGCNLLVTEARGIGLSNIRNRVEAFNGSLDVSTAPGKGFRLEVSMPA